MIALVGPLGMERATTWVSRTTKKTAASSEKLLFAPQSLAGACPEKCLAAAATRQRGKGRRDTEREGEEEGEGEGERERGREGESVSRELLRGTRGTHDYHGREGQTEI